MMNSNGFLYVAAICIVTAGRVQAASPPADCDCKYLSQVPGPRTDLSGNATAAWSSFTSLLSSEVQAADESSGWDVVFYGDSITEDYRGTSIGAPTARADGTPAVFHTYFSSEYSTGIMAVAGDQIDNLLYRMQNGETPKKAPKVAVVLIGTNDFGAVDLCSGTDTDLLEAVPGANRRYSELVSYMRYNMQTTHIILVAILPRAGWTLDDKWAHPNRFTTPISKVNTYIQGLAKKDPMLHYINCNAAFMNSTDIMDSLLPDGLHPNYVGMALLAQCYSPLIARLVTALPTANATQAQAPAPPVSPCRSANGTVEGTRDIPATQLSPDVEGTRDIPAAQLSPDAASAAPRPASNPAVPTPAAAADRPPPADLFGALRGFFPDGTGGVTLSRAEAMAARSRTMIAAAPDPDCPLC